ncbi:DUF3781 domain-containing protein [Flavobacterium sp. PL002]|uniref:DUF3781 domain-containing protein n=1 Tax=Flavobacterium sp. PL002 TaxID=1897058 RepID=UPI001787DD5E|nr:DUF3781 domain-containing protein [Flavobacterium sp. PL002]MBE0393638.1 hypothetical protein [Flavobacterium sp. PL002]
MNTIKTEILDKLCYTDLVYQRINKKLKTNFSNDHIESMLATVLNETELNFFKKTGKNFYVSNEINNIRITINSYTFRVITVDRIVK